MVAIGGKSKVVKPSQPQWVVKLADHLNEYMKLITVGTDLLVTWVGDPNAATQFSSKYNAKMRVREIENVPDTRCFKELA